MATLRSFLILFSAPVAVEAFAGRADAVSPIFTHRELSYREDGGGTMSNGILLPRALLETILCDKAGIPFPELSVRHVGIDTLLHEHLYIGLGVEAGIGGELGCLECVRGADSNKVLQGALHHGLQESMLLGAP